MSQLKTRAVKILVVCALGAFAFVACATNKSDLPEDRPSNSQASMSRVPPPGDTIDEAREHDASDADRQAIQRLCDEMWATTDPATLRGHARRLVEHGSAAYDALITVWQHCPDVGARRIAWRALHRADALPPDHPTRDPVRQYQNADALQQEVWISEAGRRPWKGVARMIDDLQDENPVVRIGAAMTLAGKDAADARTAARLPATFRVHSLRDVPIAVRALAGCGETADQVIDYLVMRSSRPDELRRIEVLAWFENGLPIERLAREIGRALGKSRSQFRGLGSTIEQLVAEHDVIARAAASPDWRTADVAWRLLQTREHKPTDDELLAFLGHDGTLAEEAVRLLAQRAFPDRANLFSRIESRIDESRPLFEKYLELCAKRGGTNILLVNPAARPGALEHVPSQHHPVLHAFIRLHEKATDAGRLAAVAELTEAVTEAVPIENTVAGIPGREYYRGPILTLLRQPDAVDEQSGTTVHARLLQLLADLDTSISWRREPDRFVAEQNVLVRLIDRIHPAAALELLVCLAKYAPAELASRADWVAECWPDEPTPEHAYALCTAISRMADPVRFRAKAWQLYERMLPDADSDELELLHQATRAVGLDAGVVAHQLQRLDDPTALDRLYRAAELFTGYRELTTTEAAAALTILLDPREFDRTACEQIARDERSFRPDPDLDADIQLALFRQRNDVKRSLTLAFVLMAFNTAGIGKGQSPLFLPSRGSRELSLPEHYRDAVLLVAGRPGLSGRQAAALAIRRPGDQLEVALGLVAGVLHGDERAAAGGRMIARIGRRAWRHAPDLARLLRDHGDTVDANWTASVLEALGSFGPHAGDTLPLLLRFTENRYDEVVRAAAVRAIGELIGNSESLNNEAISALASVGRSDSAQLRQVFAEVILTSGLRAASTAPVLAHIIRLGPRQGRRDATRALWALGPDVAAGALLDELVDAGEHPDAALPVLQALGDGDPGDSPDPVGAERLIRPWLDLDVTRIAASAAICLHGSDDAVRDVLPTVVAALGDDPWAHAPSEDEPYEIVSLRALRRKPIPAEESNCDAHRLIRALRHCGPMAGKAGGIEALLHFVRVVGREYGELDPDRPLGAYSQRLHAVADAARRAVRHLGPPERVIPALRKLGGGKDTEWVHELLQVDGGWRFLVDEMDDFWHVRRIRDVGTAARPLVPALMERWQQFAAAFPEAAYQAKGTMSAIAASAPPHVSWPVVATALDQADLKEEAFKELPRYATYLPAHETAFPLLREQALQPEARGGIVRPRTEHPNIDLLEAVVQFAEADPSLTDDAIRTIVQAAADTPPDADDRVELCRLLARLGPVEESIEFVSASLATAHPDVRAAALGTLSVWQTDAPSLADNVRKLIANCTEDPSPVIRSRALALLENRE